MSAGAALFVASIAAVRVAAFRRQKTPATAAAAGAAAGAAVVSQKSAAVVGQVNLDGTSTVSAPGKVLIAGGYLVLERPNVGVTISSTSRFYSTVALVARPPSSSSSSTPAPAPAPAPTVLSILVESPQFYSRFEYQFDAVTARLVSTGAASNEFVEKCLYMVLSFVKEACGADHFAAVVAAIAQRGVALGVKLRADNDFYSQIKELRQRSLPLLSTSLQKLPRFHPCPRDSVSGAVEVNKTGMGSSAALTTSLVGALLQWFGVVRLGQRKGEEDRRVVHNLAQLAHAVAQGKIGSGFDVAAAVYGTQLYRRFAADSDGLGACLSATVAASVIHATVCDAALWTQTVSAFSLPQSLDIVMGDVCGGSSSASMAREVLRWRQAQAGDAEQIWRRLAEVNVKIYDGMQNLVTLSQMNSSGYYAAVAEAAEQPFDQWRSLPNPQSDAVVLQLTDLRLLFQEARGLLQRMGEGAGVEIVPAQQRLLAEATEALPGVLCAGLPGAGGHDAIFAITLSAAARARVEAKWAEMSNQQGSSVAVCPLVLRAEGGMRSGVRAEFDMAW